VNIVVNQQQPNLLRLGLLVLGLYAVHEVLAGPHDTINYVFWYRNRIVYHGICYVDRFETRMDEHERNGLLFDKYDFDRPKPRERAIELERLLIKRDRPKYNCHHNCA